MSAVMSTYKHDSSLRGLQSSEEHTLIIQSHRWKVHLNINECYKEWHMAMCEPILGDREDRHILPEETLFVELKYEG